MEQKLHRSKDEKEDISTAVASATLPDYRFINASGHREQLDRNFGIVSIICYAITAGNCWVSLGVYHWATITGGKHGRVAGFFAGWWNFLGWLLALASVCQISGAQTVSIPSINIPKAILAQFVIGFSTTFFYLLSIFYGITDLDSVLEESTRYFPLAPIYRQATGSARGTLGLLILSFLPLLIACIGLYLTSSRTFWTLARDNATPFSHFFSQVSPHYRNPANAILLCAVLCTLLGCIYVGSKTAFSAFVGSFVVFTTLSYLAAILPLLLHKRANITPGWFWMQGATGFIVNGISVIYIIVFIIIFCFPFALPTDAATMNYSSLITGGLTLVVAVFWVWRRKEYVGPQQVILVDNAMLAKDAI
ncbi:MAG: hypothetical protein Q9213_004754 [Squamulea squamosa]